MNLVVIKPIPEKTNKNNIQISKAQILPTNYPKFPYHLCYQPSTHYQPTSSPTTTGRRKRPYPWAWWWRSHTVQCRRIRRRMRRDGRGGARRLGLPHQLHRRELGTVASRTLGLIKQPTTQHGWDKFTNKLLLVVNQ